MSKGPLILAGALAFHAAAPGWSQARHGSTGSPRAAHSPVSDTTFLCFVSIDGTSGNTVDVRFRGIPGNQAATNRNGVSVWPNSVIPWSMEPLARAPVLVDGEEGSLVLVGVPITAFSYVVGYAVGPRTADTCASAQLRPDGSLGVTDAVSLEISAIGSTSILLRYHTLAGYLPRSAGNWIGLWRGRASPYEPPRVVARLDIPDDVTDDQVQIAGVPLRVDTPYTLVYFMGPELSTAAVMIHFVTPAPRCETARPRQSPGPTGPPCIAG